MNEIFKNPNEIKAKMNETLGKYQMTMQVKDKMITSFRFYRSVNLSVRDNDLDNPKQCDKKPKLTHSTDLFIC